MEKAKFNTYLDRDLIRWVKLTAVKQHRRPAPLITDALTIYRGIIKVLPKLKAEAKDRDMPVEDVIAAILNQHVEGN